MVKNVDSAITTTQRLRRFARCDVTVNLRWGWLAFNSGSTYGVTGERWQYAARAAVSTMMGSIGGGLVGLGFSLTNPNGIDILSQINGILGALVAVTGIHLIISIAREKGERFLLDF